MVNINSNILMVLSQSRNSSAEGVACHIADRFSARHSVISINIVLCGESRGSVDAYSPSYFSEGFSLRYDGFIYTDSEIPPPGQAGSIRTMTLFVRPGHIKEAMGVVSEILPSDSLAVCYSSCGEIPSLLLPGVLLWCDNSETLTRESPMERSEMPLFAGYEEIAVARVSCAGSFDYTRLSVSAGRWRVAMKASAIILAGGKSSRMGGADKALLPMENVTLLEYLVSSLGEWFAEIVVSAGERERYNVQGALVVGDSLSGIGPVMGLVEGLKAASGDLSYVTAVDMPEIKPGIISRLIEMARGADGAILVSGVKAEPLCAVYRHTVTEYAGKYIAGGGRSMMGLVEKLRVNVLIVDHSLRLPNINTMEDFEKYRGGAASVTDS